MKPLIKDDAVQKNLAEKGISSIHFSSTELIDRIRKVFESLHPVQTETMTSGYYFSIFGNDREYRQALYDNILPLVAESLNSVFTDFKVLAIIGQIKGAGPNSAVTIHQDLTMVDESKYRSYTLWVPLEDSTERNGALSFLESSHLSLRNYRTHAVGYLFEAAEDFIRQNAKIYLTPKGEALIFDTATLHFSGPNQTDRSRYSLGISVVSKDAETEILHYDKFKPFDGTADRYAVPNNFWYRYDNFEKQRLLPPEFGKLIGSRIGLRVLPYTKTEFIRHYRIGLESLIKSQFCASVVPILKDSDLQSKLNTEGFILVDFLTPSEVENLQALFDRLNASRTDIPYDRLYTCLHNPDQNYRQQMNLEIGNILMPIFDRYFSNVKSTVFTFQIKGIGKESELYAHQDWNFTREDEGYRTYTLWISLIDSDERNGTLSVFPGSHLKVKNIRGAGIEPLFSGKQQEIIPYLTPLSIKAGQLMLFDSALLHYSSANHSNSIRVSVMTNILPADAEVFLYFQNMENSSLVDEYQVPTDFFLLYNDFKNEYERPPSFGTKQRTLTQGGAATLVDDFFNDSELIEFPQ